MRRIFLIVTAVLMLVAGVAVMASGRAAGSDVAQHGPITINSNADLTRPGSATGCACVLSGSGAPSSPYVIGPWAIPAPSSDSSGWAIKVDNSSGGITAFFAIAGISANYSGVPYSDPVIWLKDVSNQTTISNVSANGDGRGVELDGSSNIFLDSLSFNKMTGNSLFINGSSHISLSNSKLKSTADGQAPHNADGLYALNSSYLNVGGVADCPRSQTCNTFDYDTGWGIYLQSTHDVKIEYASANADDTGSYILDNAWNVDLGNSTAQGDGPICITLGGQKAFTGYYTDLQGGLILVNGSHNNTVHDDQFSADIGVSLGSGGNGLFVNPCIGQQPFNPVEAPMGSSNSFTNTCYSSNDLGLPPDPCK